MFEEAFAKENVPLEIKYLSIVESALNRRQFLELLDFGSLCIKLEIIF
jgi:RNase P/RNase MRP subunit p30